MSAGVATGSILRPKAGDARRRQMDAEEFSPCAAGRLGGRITAAGREKGRKPKRSFPLRRPKAEAAFSPIRREELP